MSRITTVQDKIPQKASWPGFLASGKDSRTKVVLARKLEKQGLGSTPALLQMIRNLMSFSDLVIPVMVRTTTFREAEFMSIVLTVTWLSVQTPTTCITDVTIAIIISVNLTWAPMSVNLSLNDFHSSASSSVSLLNSV